MKLKKCFLQKRATGWKGRTNSLVHTASFERSSISEKRVFRHFSQWPKGNDIDWLPINGKTECCLKSLVYSNHNFFTNLIWVVRRAAEGAADGNSIKSYYWSLQNHFQNRKPCGEKVRYIFARVGRPFMCPYWTGYNLQAQYSWDLIHFLKTIKCMAEAGETCLMSVMQHALPMTLVKLLERAQVQNFYMI